MPIAYSTLVRQFMVLLLAAHAFFMYTQARALTATVGLQFSSIVTAVLFATVLMLPFVWCFGLADLPEVWMNHVRPMRRWKRGQCTSCGYDLAHLQSDVCPECGETISPPQPYRFGWYTIRRFVMMIVISLSLGCVAGELLVSIDEASFRREVRARISEGATGPYSRPRTWPVDSASLIFDPASGFSATD